MAAAARGPHVLREINRGLVLTTLRHGHPEQPRVADLVEATGLSRPAVTRALADLAAAGLIELLDAVEEGSQLGRPAQRARFRADLGLVAGVDVGPHKTLVVLADLAGTTLATRRLDVRALTTGPEILEVVRAAILGCAADARVPVTDLWAIAVGTPGIVDHATGDVRLAPSIPGWAGLPIVADLRSWFGCPVLIDNDVNLAVLAERWRGVAAGVDSLVFVQWGERIGAGIVVDGRPHRGAGEAAGELGFLDVTGDPDAPVAELTADGVGPFERLVGAAAIRDLALAASADAPDLHALLTASGADLVAAALFAAAQRGDEVAVATVERVAARFAHGLAPLVLLLDPELVVVGGGVSRAGEPLLAAVARHLGRRVLVPPALALSSLGEEAVAVGAVRHALDAVEPRLEPGARLA